MYETNHNQIKLAASLMNFSISEAFCPFNLIVHKAYVDCQLIFLDPFFFLLLNQRGGRGTK